MKVKLADRTSLATPGKQPIRVTDPNAFLQCDRTVNAEHLEPHKHFVYVLRMMPVAVESVEFEGFGNTASGSQPQFAVEMMNPGSGCYSVFMSDADPCLPSSS